MKKILSLDLTDNSFRELEVTRTNINKYGVSIWYDDCITPMYLNIDKYTDLTMGRITELHPDEINLLLIRE